MYILAYVRTYVIVTRLLKNIEFKKGVGIAIKSKETSSSWVAMYVHAQIKHIL